jgi:protein-S-isoprenylcysteine O-methyltransferase Ste14
MLRPVILAGLFFVFLAVVLFGSAGGIDWPMGWAFLGAYLAFMVMGFLLFDPELIRERSHIGMGAKGWDVALASFSFIWLFPLTLIVAGLDVGRFGWSPPVPPVLEILALVVFVIATAFAFWAVRTNRFFSTFVRIQEERGHHVITDGPYAYVRHPGYAGVILATLALPLALGSLWALVPAGIGASLFALRALLEDRTLEEELPGYREYAGRVRWLLLPGVW